MRKNHITTIIKVTESCNFDCLYCLRNVKASSSISIKTIDAYFRKLSRYRDFVSIQNIWHGGEPLLMGVDFYEEAMAIVKHYFPKTNIINSIQTNGFLLDRYIDFLKKSRVGVGISLDGPEDINNQRVLKNGASPFKKIMDNMRMLRENNIHYGTVGVLTSKAIGHEKRIYDFLKSVTQGARLNLVSPDGLNKESVTDNGIVLSITEAAQILVRFYDIWKSDEPNEGRVFQLRPFTEMVEALFTGKNSVCEFSKGCEDYLCLGCNGSIYPCGRFSSNDDFCMGNILENDFNQIYNSLPEKLRKQRLEYIETACFNCQYKNICCGGCAHHSFAWGNYIDKTPYCAAYQALFEHIKKSLS